MLSLKELLSLWGFSEHPFESYTAEKEVRLTDYFVAPPYLDDVLGTAASAAPSIVFGARGIGKSAIRIYVENLCGSGDPSGLLKGRVVAVTYDDFRPALRHGLERISLEAHLEVILQKMACAALIRIAHRLGGAPPTKENIAEKFSTLDLSTFSRLVATYFVNLSELQRENSFHGVYDYFKNEAALLSDRAGWFQRVWRSIRVPLFDLANVIQSIRGKEHAGPTPFYKPSASRQNKDSVTDDFQTIANMAPQLDFDAWYVLVDKVDEDEHTDGDAAKAAQMILPLLKSLRVIETSRVAFKFFLWEHLRPTLVEESVRLDKIRNFEMSWTDSELREMTNRRLMAFSSGSIKDLRQLIEPRESIFGLVLKYAIKSPREIVHVIDAIFREHARHSTSENGAMITEESIDRGLDEYCMRRVKDVYPQDLIRRITRLSSTFTANDFMQTFKVSKAVASRRINSWVDNGYIRQVADARSKKDPSKPVFQYEVSEPRLRRILDKGLAKYEDP